MSGSSGGGGNIPDWQDNCVTLNFTTQLASPKQSVIQKLVVGSVLDIMLIQIPGGTSVAALFDGEVAGGIASTLLAKLRECLLQDYGYHATVTSIDDGMVTVRVSVAPKK